LRVAFAGTPPFAARALEAIAAAGHAIPLVLTQPDRPAGRGLKLTASAVADTASRLGLPLAKPASLKTPESQALLSAAAVDVMVVAAYGLLLPAAVLVLPRHGCINIHASLLPRWRGAAPIQRALLAGDAETGISIMQMDAGLDTGPVLLEKRHPIGPRDTTATLTTALADLGAEAIVEALARLQSLHPMPQDESRATYAAKVRKAEARLEWALPASVLERQVRAFNPAPGAEAVVGEEPMKIWQAEVGAGRGRPGEVLQSGPAGILVACGEGALRLLELQRPGGKRLTAADFLRGRGSDAKNLAAGER
jgi:methionyl-tRNA formyltransferase